MSLRYCHHDSPVGPLLLAGDGKALRLLSFPSGHKAVAPQEDWQPDPTAFDAVRHQLDAYFCGDLRAFSVPLDIHGTEFQKKIWALLTAIPYAETRSYGEIARTLGSPGASRAVGAANGANPLPIILPCHRVIGKSGALTGFGGGLDTKTWLLQHEATIAGVAGRQLSLF
ncbi:methylated-DNA--[protein]-cysteine S-methyltransferase [Salipiger bermudensis]|uniref:Methylated-DNA--protein-cysteine methyltransferase n=1 Tax=Salipiger bermudensis (strain DSM 26914 / JCM 13377 / KCTC 12554 / HTCC2601) TaxID=314265 RepID=Q0FVQ4_SALBH|nr:methylated-DNA--[protein]-cysteine S-methyltransferase [Salipiger bermudensis]EAU48072.1 probable methylated-dna--protein-cysteine methyltransferase ogt (6-o-methylguanine-dna methyltransferase) [Salipiger bermudensis HTCC2601]